MFSVEVAALANHCAVSNNSMSERLRVAPPGFWRSLYERLQLHVYIGTRSVGGQIPEQAGPRQGKENISDDVALTQTGRIVELRSKHT